MMYSQENGLRVKVPAFCANELIKYLPEGVKPTRYIIDLILRDLATKKKDHSTSDENSTGNNNSPV